LIQVERSNTPSEGRVIDCEDRCLQIINYGRLEYGRKQSLRFRKPEVQRPAEIKTVDLRGHVSVDISFWKTALQRKLRFDI
jgi:hypothetical protein